MEKNGMTETEYTLDERIAMSEGVIGSVTVDLRRHARDMLTLQKTFDRVVKSIEHNATKKRLSDLDGVKNGLELMAATVQCNLERYSNALDDLKAAKKAKRRASRASRARFKR